MSLAWHIVALSHVPAKKFPKHDKMQIKNGASPSHRKKQTPEQMLAIVKMLNAAYGGSIVHKKRTEH